MKKYFVGLLVVFLLIVIIADGQVKINEIVPKGGTNKELVELYNTGESPVNLDGWRILNSSSDEKSLNGRTIGAHNFDTLLVGFDLDNDGDIVYLVDAFDDTVDQVGFGIQGGAPVAPYSPLFSIARITDGQDTDDDARDFNLDGTPTPEATNDPDSILLGSSLIINEIRPYPTSGGDSVELYNPTGTPYDIQGWFLSDGDDYESIVTDITVPAGGFAVLDCDVDLSATVNFTDYDVCYLFTDDSVRIDQLGWYGKDNNFSFQRYPDGAEPNDGYDWITSGGDTTLFDAPPTWGGSNTSGVEERDMPVGYKLTVPGISKGNISIQYTLPERAYMTISLFDQLGRRVSVLVDKTQEPGYYSVATSGNNFPSGLYIIMMETPSFKSTERLLLIR